MGRRGQERVVYKARQPGFGCAAQILRAGWLGVPIDLTSDDDLREIEEVRSRLARGDEGPLAHRGEAASIVLARRLVGSGIVMDDSDGRAVAAAEGIPTATTLDLLDALVDRGTFECEAAFEIFIRMTRVSRVPHRERQDFCPPCWAHR